MTNPELSRDDLLQRYTKKARAVPTEGPRRSPFKFLDSYDIDDADIFFGRDAEIEELLRHFHGLGHVLIYGESGSGKSSLLQCGVRARIPESDALFISLRVHAAGLSTVCRQIYESAAQALGVEAEIPPDVTLIEALREVREAASRPVVLFFDQFEELFIFHDQVTRQRFAEELAAIPKAKINVKVIIGVRQDYLAHLSELEDTVEGLFDNRFWLRRMSRENAAHAVVQACATCDVKIEAALAESVINRLDPGGLGVELPYLQVVMDRLYREAIAADPEHPEITAADVEKLGDIANILGAFLVEEVAKLPSPDTGRQMLKAFVTREATRRSLDLAAVAREAASFGEAISPDVLDAHLDQLASVRILREVADTGTFELRHDALAATVAGWISEVEKELIEVRDNLLNRFKEYEARGRPEDALLDRGFLDYLAVYRQRLKPLLGDALHEYVEESRRHVEATQRRRRRAKQIVTGVVGSVILACLVVAVWKWYEADEARVDAEAKKEHAHRLLSKSYIERGAGEVENGNLAHAITWFHAAYEEAGLGDDQALRQSARALIGAWRPRLGRLLPHELPIHSVAIDRDGMILTGGDHRPGGAAQLWDEETGAPVGSPMVHDDVVWSVALSPDGKTVLTGSGDRTARLWRIEDGELLRTLPHEAAVRAVAFSPNGATVLTGSGKAARLWNARDGKPIRALPPHGRPVRAVAFSPDGDTILTGSEDKTARLWDAADGTPLAELTHGGRVFTVAFSPDGRTILTGGDDRSARLWRAKNGKWKQQVDLKHDGWVIAAAFSPNGKTVLTGSKDATARSWDVETGEPRGVPMKHDDEVTGVAFSSNGRTILTGSGDKTARLWDAPLGPPPLKHEDWVNAVAFSPEHPIVLTASAQTTRLWNAETGDSLPESMTHDEEVTGIAFTPDGKSILAGSWAAGARLWSVGTGTPPVELDRDGDAHIVAFSPNSRTILTGSWNEGARLWWAESGDQRGVSMPHDELNGATFSPDGKTVLTSGRKTAQLWDVETQTKTPHGELPHDANVESAMFSPDGEMVLTVCTDKTARLWSSETGALRTELKHEHVVTCAALSPDGRTIVTGSDDRTVRLWDAETGELHSVQMTHDKEITAAVFSPDGRAVLTGSKDKTARLWDTKTGELLGVPMQHDDEITVVTFSPDGKTVLTGSKDGTARLWDVAEPAPDDPDRLRLKVEVQTVLYLDEGTIRRLTRRQWLERNSKLAALRRGR